MSPASNSDLSPQRSRRVLAWVRRGVVLYAICAVLYLSWRFDLRTLPREGVTPLLEFRPGTHLLIDQQSRAMHSGDALLFRDAQGRYLLARLAEKPNTEAKPGLWLLADNPGIALPDSTTLGPIAPEQVVGRVVCALPGME